MFPVRLEKPVRVKAPLAFKVMRQLLQALAPLLHHRDGIQNSMAARDILMLYLGYFCLLRRSEVVTTAASHFHFSSTSTEGGDYLWIPQSKTDQAKKGCRVPLPRHVPVIGDIQTIVHRITDVFALLDWPVNTTPLMFTYSAASKNISARPI